MKLIIVALFLAQSAFSITEKEAKEFFEQAVQLSKTFSPKIADFYADDAKVSAVRIEADNSEKPMQLTGAQLKRILLGALEIAKNKGDSNSYTDVKIKINQDIATVTAKRYSYLKCFTDTDYYMKIKKSSKKLFIIEEHIRSPTKSSCKDQPKVDAQKMMQALTKPLEGKLPIAVDEETKLMEVQTSPSQLKYIYQLVNVVEGELDMDVFTITMLPILKKQSCNAPGLSDVIKAGASIVYLYNDKADKKLIEIELTAKDCPE